MLKCLNSNLIVCYISMARTKKPDSKSTVEGKLLLKNYNFCIFQKVKKEVKAETPVVTSTEEPAMENTVTDATVVTSTEAPDSLCFGSRIYCFVSSPGSSQQLSLSRILFAP